MSIVIRPATPIDASEILLLCMEHHGDVQPVFGAVSDEKVAAAFVSISRVILSGVAFVATVPETGEIAGSIGGEPAQDWWSSAWSLFEMWWYVRPRHRHGIEPAAALMRAFSERGRALGMPTRFYDVTQTDEQHHAAMRRFMRRLGFQAIGSSFVSEA